MGGGVSSSSEETSNDRGAKCWQIVIAGEGNLCPYTAKTEIRRQQNLNA